MYWRPLMINPLMVLAVAVAGGAGCRWAGADWHPRELAAAAGVSLLSAEIAVALLLRQRNGATVEVAQAALLSLALHLLLSLVLAAALMLSKQVRPAFVWWALAMFWTTLIGVSLVLVRAVRTAAGSANAGAGAGPVARKAADE